MKLTARVNVDEVSWHLNLFVCVLVLIRYLLTLLVAVLPAKCWWERVDGCRAVKGTSNKKI